MIRRLVGRRRAGRGGAQRRRPARSGGGGAEPCCCSGRCRRASASARSSRRSPGRAGRGRGRVRRRGERAARRGSSGPPQRRDVARARSPTPRTSRACSATRSVLVHVSRAEVQSLAVIETLAQGTPVVLSDIPSHRELAAALPGVGPPGGGPETSAGRSRLRRAAARRGRRRGSRAGTTSRAARGASTRACDEALHLTPELPYAPGGTGGATRQFELLRGLAARGHEVAVVAPVGPAGQGAQPLPAAGMRSMRAVVRRRGSPRPCARCRAPGADRACRAATR